MQTTRTALTLPAIIDAAHGILVTEGLDAVSLRRVAGTLGVTAPALYAHVDSKQALLQAIAEDEFLNLMRAFTEAGAAASNPVERVRLEAKAYVRFALDNPRSFEAMFLYRPELTALAHGEALPLATQAFNTGLASVQDAIDSGAFRPIDPMLAALTIWTTTHGCATVMLSGPELQPGPDDSTAAAIIDTVIDGLCS